MFKNILSHTSRSAMHQVASRNFFLRAKVMQSVQLIPMTGRFMSTPTPVDESTYIKEMEDAEKDWDTAMANRTRPVLIQAGASWCGPCQYLKPILLEEIKKFNGAVEYLYVDIDKHQQIAQMLQIQSIPICYMIKNGQLVDSMPGAAKEEKLREFIQKGIDHK